MTALTAAACFEREEPYAREVYATGVTPRVVLPACGLHQVTDAGRFARRKPRLSRFVTERDLVLQDNGCGAWWARCTASSLLPCSSSG